MSEQAEGRSRFRLVGTSLVCAYIGLVFAHLLLTGTLSLTAKNVFFANDQSTDFIVARYAERGIWPLLGPPTHIGGRHLGPIYYWYTIAIAKFAAFDIVSAAQLFSLSKVVAAIIILGCIAAASAGGTAIGSVLGAAIVFLCAQYHHVINVQWHSNYLLFPSAFAFGTALGTVKFPVRFFPFFFVSLALLGLSHLSSAPVVLGLSLSVLLYLYRAGALKIALMQRTTALAALLCAALMLPTMFYEITYPSNIHRLLHASHGVQAEKFIGLPSALQGAGVFLLKNSLSLQFHSVPKILQSTFILLIFLATLVHGMRTRTGRFRWAVAVVLVPVILTAVILGFFRSPLHPHYFNSSIAAPIFLIAIVGQHAAYLFLSRRNHKVIRSVTGLLLLLAFFSFFVRRLVVPQVRTAFKKSAPFSFADISFTSQLIENDAAALKATPPLVYFRLTAKFVRNSYYYLFDTGSPEVEYKDYFLELPQTFNEHRVPISKMSHSYFFMCGVPHAALERSLLAPFKEEWTEDESFFIYSCKIIRLKRKTASDGGPAV